MALRDENLVRDFSGNPNPTPKAPENVPTPNPRSQFGAGNIDLTTRPHVKNADGSVSTVLSKSFNFGGKEVLLPTVGDEGKIISDAEAISRYKATGKNLGVFDTIAEADKYAQSLHEAQAETIPVGQPTGPAAPVFAEGSYSVVDNDGEKNIFFTGPDGNFEKIGSTSLPDAKDLLDKAGKYNPITGSWEVPKDVALSLAKGNMPFPEFIKKMYTSGEATVVRGLWGDKWIFGGASREDAQAHGNIERLKIINNEHPALAWSEAPFSKFVGELRWGVGVVVGLTPFTAGAAGESFKTAAYWGVALPAVTALTLGPGAPALANPVALAGLISTGASTGAAYGAARYTMKVEGGNLALDMLDKGFSEKTTRAIAPAAGAVMGLLEIAGLKYMTAPMKRAFFSKVVLSEPMQKVISTWYANYAKELGGEVSIEMAQQAVGEASKALGALADKNPELLSSKEEIIQGFIQTFMSSLVGMGLLKLPGVALDIHTERAQKAAMRSIKAEVADGAKPMSPEAVEKILMAEAGKGPVIEAKKLNDILAGKGDAKEFGAANADNVAAKTAVAAKMQSLSFTIKSVVNEAGGGDANALPPKIAEQLVPLVEALRTMGDVAEGMNNPPKSLGAAAANEPMLPSKEAKTAPEFIERRFREQDAVMKALTREADGLDKELTAVNDEIVTRAEEGLTTVALKAKANKLAVQIQEVQAKGAEIVMSPMGHEEILANHLAETGAEGIIQASELINMERDLAARVEKAHVSAFRHGAAYAKREVAKVQAYINTLIDRSALPKEDKAKFMAVMRNTTTLEQLDHNYPEIRDRIFKAEDEARAKASAAMLAKLLKANKVKSQAGKPVSKIGDPHIQRIVDNARKVMKMTRTEAEDNLTAEAYDRFINSKDATAEGYSPEKDAEEHHKYQALLYRAGRLSNKDSMVFARETAEMVAGAKSRYMERRSREAEARKVLKASLAAELRGNVEMPGDWKNTETKDFGWVHGAEKAKSKAWVIGDGWIADLDGLADILSSRAAAKKGESLLSKTFHTVDSALAEDAAQNEFHGLMRDAYSEAYEFEGDDAAAVDRQIRRQHVRDFERHKLAGPEGGKFVNANKVAVELEYSVAEARKRFMERQDPTLSENFTHPEAMAYTPEMESAIFGLLSEQDKVFALRQIDAYREIYKKINKVYREIFSVDLPFNEFYSPIHVVGHVEAEGADIGLAAVKQEVGARTTMGGSFKSRVKHYHALAQMADVEVYNRHSVNMAHFLAWEKKIREWNSILADGEFKASATGIYGSHTLRALKSAVEDITASDRKFQLFQSMERFWSNLITAEVIFKPLAVPKQLTSVIAFADPVPVEHIHLFLGEFAAPIREKGFHPDILNCDFVQNRGMNFSREIKAFKDAVESGSIADNPNIVEYGAKFIQWGDKASILIGGDALYRYLRKQGKTKEEAIRIFSETAMKTQSSGITANLSALQRQNGFMRLLTAYQNQPIQMMRKELEALRAIATEGFAQGEGRMSRSDVMKALVIYHFMMPMFYQFVIDWGWDEKNQKRAAVLGSFNNLPILADAIAAGYAAIFRESSPNSGLGTIWDGYIKKGARGVENLFKSHKLSDYADALATIGDVIAKGRYGVPLQPAVNAAKGAAKVVEGKVEDGIRLVMGYSPYAIKKQNKRDGGNSRSELW